MQLKYIHILLSTILLVFFAQSCGRAYFPMELKTISRSERQAKQQTQVIDLQPMTKKTIKQANKTTYVRRIIDAGDLTKPAKILNATNVIQENYPSNNNPGPYLLGEGDVLSYAKEDSRRQLLQRRIRISDDGFVNLIGVGSIKATGLTQTELEDLIYNRHVGKGDLNDFELSIIEFKSKKIFVNGDGITPQSIAYTNYPIFVEDILKEVNWKNISNGGKKSGDSKVTIYRGNSIFNLSLESLSKGKRPKVRLFPNDKIYLQRLNYKPEYILLVGETGTQRSVEISAYSRPSLADTIFRTSALNVTTSDFSQLYVIRENKNGFTAFHLDISEPSRISLANKFEMRPDDIVFVGTQPLSLYSRALSQILGSTGLTIQIRDQVRKELD